ncbi:hypothetical protein, partial [uncultured Mobiluncus sp.]|uniref:hypothetical protein n=1 Tax=uncultured Mobiluncus sp. TaxID=293425 RepID=UPI0026246DFF
GQGVAGSNPVSPTNALVKYCLGQQDFQLNSKSTLKTTLITRKIKMLFPHGGCYGWVILGINPVLEVITAPVHSPSVGQQHGRESRLIPPASLA